MIYIMIFSLDNIMIISLIYIYGIIDIFVPTLKAGMVCLQCNNCVIPERFTGELLTMGRRAMQTYLPFTTKIKRD